MTEKRHPGISMHKLPVGGGFVGILFAAGSALIFVLGLPALWYFVAFSSALGLGLALLFRVLNQRRSDHMKPLSILDAQRESAQRPVSNGNRRNLLAVLPSPYPSTSPS